ncbi:MAG: hypothetical protein WDO69_33720 [Pseudomonadota bacterium]
MTLREQDASTCQGYDNDPGGDLAAAALDSFSLYAGVEAGLFSSGLGEFGPDRVLLVDDEHDGVFGCEPANGSSSQHHGHGVPIGMKQMETGVCAGDFEAH